VRSVEIEKNFSRKGAKTPRRKRRRKIKDIFCSLQAGFDDHRRAAKLPVDQNQENLGVLAPLRLGARISLSSIFREEEFLAQRRQDAKKIRKKRMKDIFWGTCTGIRWLSTQKALETERKTPWRLGALARGSLSLRSSEGKNFSRKGAKTPRR